MYNLGRLPGMLPQEGYDGIPTALGGLNAVPQMGGGISSGGVPAQPAQGLPSPVPGGQQPVAQQPSWLQALAPPQGAMPQPAQGAPQAPAIPQAPGGAPPSWVSSLMPPQGIMPPSAQGVPQSGGTPQPAAAQPGQRPSWVSSLLPPGANQAPGSPRRPMQSRWGSRMGSGRRPGMFGGIRERLY